MWLAQVTIPLTPRGDRQIATTVVVAALAAGVALLAVGRLGVRRAGAVAAICCATGLAAEVVGTRTGLPFGDYAYTDELTPQVLGVPVVVVLAWFGMGLPATAVARRIVVGGGALRRAARVGVAAVALTGWDLFLDPQMVREGYWVWPGGGAYRGIPLSNFAGWLVVSALLAAALERPAEASGDDRALAGVFALMAVMEAVGFAVFFGDLVVAAAGAAVCLPLALAALGRAPVARAAHPTTRAGIA